MFASVLMLLVYSLITYYQRNIKTRIHPQLYVCVVSPTPGTHDSRTESHDQRWDDALTSGAVGAKL